MTTNHDTLKSLVLSYEELPAEERQRADSHLAECSSCSALLSHLQEIESAPGPSGMLPDLESLGARTFPSLEDARAADASLAALRNRLGFAADRIDAATSALSRRQPRRTMFQGWLRPALPLAAAATIAVTLVAIRHERADDPLTRIQLVAQTSRGGAAEGGDTGAVPSWHRGDAFSLRFELSHPAHPVVFLLDATGQLSLLFPEHAEDSPKRLPAGPVELPLAESDHEWVLAGNAGPLAFFAVAARNDGLAIAPLLAEARTEAAPGRSRADQVRDITAFLETRLGPVDVIEATLLP